MATGNSAATERMNQENPGDYPELSGQHSQAIAVHFAKRQQVYDRMIAKGYKPEEVEWYFAKLDSKEEASE